MEVPLSRIGGIVRNRHGIGLHSLIQIVLSDFNQWFVFVELNDELHRILSGLPLFPYMELKVTPLAQHTSALKDIKR